MRKWTEIRLINIQIILLRKTANIMLRLINSFENKKERLIGWRFDIYEKVTNIKEKANILKGIKSPALYKGSKECTRSR